VIPTSLKILTAAVRRAEELEKDTSSSSHESKVVAYFCRLYVVSKGSKLSAGDPDAGKFLLSQMDILEKSKPALGPDTNKEKGFEVCKKFALRAFALADEEDRSGVADKATAKIFYSAGTFFDILEQFGELDADLQEKKVYSKWKATDILNAFKEGRQPTPGGFGEQTSEVQSDPPIPSIPPQNPSFLNINATLSAPEPQSPVIQQPKHQFIHTAPPSNGSKAPASNILPGVVNTAPPLSNLDPRVKDAVELCYFAISSMKHNELGLARDRLKEALKRLG